MWLYDIILIFIIYSTILAWWIRAFPVLGKPSVNENAYDKSMVNPSSMAVQASSFWLGHDWCLRWQGLYLRTRSRGRFPRCDDDFPASTMVYTCVTYNTIHMFYHVWLYLPVYRWPSINFNCSFTSMELSNINERFDDSLGYCKVS